MAQSLNTNRQLGSVLYRKLLIANNASSHVVSDHTLLTFVLHHLSSAKPKPIFMKLPSYIKKVLLSSSR